MKAALAVEKSSEKPLMFLPKGDFVERAQALYISIAKRAFEIFEENGCQDGYDLANWLEAESEFLHPAHVKLAESNGVFTLKTEVPGFTASDLEVSIEPTRLTISGRRETQGENKKDKVLQTDRCLDQILRVVELPSQVDTGRVTATLQDGVLELTMPKLPAPTSIAIPGAGT